ncbi:hypothetical protein M433DRAFT_407110 [Acidomyces richmondensis BFW]|nr:MAG: hypothetical protein FE78DRAFT_211791 [Acidomyces sp. 'richmondensis']KYG48595.1 hypothetical protein M433DRAFT_407110 [Acidomyces richmondensis BFW]
MASKDTALYGLPRPRKLVGGGKEISSSTTLAFTSQLSSLISQSSKGDNPSSSKSHPSRRHGSKKDDIFTAHSRHTAKRAKQTGDNSPTASLAQVHTTEDKEVLDAAQWARSRRKMEQKARLYAAMKRGDVEDEDERYAVDFDRKWAERQEILGPDGEDSEQDDSESNSSEDLKEDDKVEYIDEFGRTRIGTRKDAARAERTKRSDEQAAADRERLPARPSAPRTIIHGDTIQYQAFDPDAPVAAQMAELARKRDRSLTPPPDEHFDSRREVRTKGVGFFQFSGDAGERRRQMEELEAERADTEKRREERRQRLAERKRMVEERKAEIVKRRGKRKAAEFLENLGKEMERKEGVKEECEAERDMIGTRETAIEREGGEHEGT